MNKLTLHSAKDLKFWALFISAPRPDNFDLIQAEADILTNFGENSDRYLEKREADPEAYPDADPDADPTGKDCPIISIPESANKKYKISNDFMQVGHIQVNSMQDGHMPYFPIANLY